eukprot:2689499-Pyramimonas_sp.AAC.1
MLALPLGQAVPSYAPGLQGQADLFHVLAASPEITGFCAHRAQGLTIILVEFARRLQPHRTIFLQH